MTTQSNSEAMVAAVMATPVRVSPSLQILQFTMNGVAFGGFHRDGLRQPSAAVDDSSEATDHHIKQADDATEQESGSQSELNRPCDIVEAVGRCRSSSGLTMIRPKIHLLGVGKRKCSQL